MKAYRYLGCSLVPCENVGPVMRVPIPPTQEERAAALRPPPPRTKNERRRRARKGHRGRRGAVRVEAVQTMVPYEPARFEVLVGHLFAGRGHVLLYLPEGVAPTEQHGRDLDTLARRDRNSWIETPTDSLRFWERGP